jgi:hypothetical protein
MPSSLEQSIVAVSPHLAPSLASKHTLSVIKSIARIFPDSCCKAFLFETRLWDEVAECDFAVMISKDDDQGIPGKCGTEFNLSAEAQESPTWSKVLNFFSQWANPTSVLHDRVREVWLEFDLAACIPGTPLPGLFFSGLVGAGSKENVLQLIRTGLEALEGRPISDDIHRNLSLSVDQLPDTAVITNVGVMLPRPYNPVKLYVGGIGPQGVIPYLSRIGWKGPHETVQAFLTGASRCLNVFNLAVEVGDNFSTSIGIECGYSYRRFYRDCLKAFYRRLIDNYLMHYHKKSLTRHMIDSRWELFLDYLVAKELCSDSKRDALLAWSSSSSNASVPHDLIEPQIVRAINHAKITFSATGELVAKAYLVAGKNFP